jgi:hypothetical protein
VAEQSVPVTALKDLLTTILDEAVFTVQRRSHEANGSIEPRDEPEHVSSAALRKIYADRNRGLSRWDTYDVQPRGLIRKLEMQLLRLPFVDQERGEVEFAFPIDNIRFLPIQRSAASYGSSLYRFSCALVQASALEGVDRAISLLEHLQQGCSLRILTCTFLDDFPLDRPISPMDGVCMHPLPLSTSDLPYLPITGDSCPLDYLGGTLLTIETREDLTYPEPIVRPDGVELDLVCNALAIHSNRYVDPTVVWYEYPEVASFCLRFEDSVSVRRRVPHKSWKMKSGNLGRAPFRWTGNC